MGRYSEAELLMAPACEALVDRFELIPKLKRENLKHIIELYESWDAAEPGRVRRKAAEWRINCSPTGNHCMERTDDLGWPEQSVTRFQRCDLSDQCPFLCRSWLHISCLGALPVTCCPLLI
jgi:hypothetical protein